ncbi:MAG: M28 family peptidase [Anaerolineales bacterium]|nr:M28 family peptidase [Anaerolineales bacterium]
MQPDHDAASAASLEAIVAHIRRLSEEIGGRGSCTPAERQAAEYAAGQLRSLGALDVDIEAFEAISSTYWPYALAFVAALLGSLLALLIDWRGMLFLGAALNALGAWAMFAETEFACHWARWPLPRKTSQNVVGRIEPSGPTCKRAVLCAHLDTHRTPVFYSSRRWHQVFSTLVGLAFVSMLVGALALSLAALLGWGWMRWLSPALLPIQAFALALCLHADFTPYSPGANDNASGVGVVLELARRLAAQPLAQTEVRLALTGCEEVAAYGMAAYLEAHSKELGDETVYVILDEVGLGTIKYLTADGLVLKHKTHPRALELARQAAASLPEIKTRQGAGIAYTDALVATLQGLPALTLCALPGPEASEASHWHQMSDTLEHVDPQALLDAYRFTWQTLKILDHLE